MTLSAVDNPFYPTGADRKSGDAAEKKSGNSKAADVFLKLLETTAVRQVASTENSKEFRETLDLHDDTTVRDPNFGATQKKSDANEFAQQAKASSDTRETDGKKADAGEDEGPKSPVQALGQNSGLLGPKSGPSGKNAGQDEAAELASLGLPTTPASLVPVKAGNQAAGDAALARNNAAEAAAKGQEIAALASAGGRQNAATEELGRSPIAVAARHGGTPNGKANGGLQAAKLPDDVVSQPASSLTASAAVTAQTARQGRTQVETAVTPAEDLDGESRVSLLNGGTLRANGRSQTNAVHPEAKPQGAVPGPESRPANAAPLPPPAPVNLQALLGTAPARSDAATLLQTGQPAVDSVTAGPVQGNSGQNAERAQQPQVPQPPKPPLRPEQLTGQVAIQIKKAIGQGANHIRIQLKPAELGRVEVKLEVDQKGHASAAVTADRADTLQLLQRDSAGLRQALQDAGLSTDSGSLSFNLRSDAGAFGQEMAERGHAPAGRDASGNATNDSSAAEAAIETAQNVISDGHVNVQI